MKLRSVLLDLDGTLLDSSPGILGCYRATLRELGHEPDPAVDLTHVIGPVMADVMPTVLAHYGETRVDLAIATWRQLYGEGGLFQASPFPGIPELLRDLHGAGLRLFLATAKRVNFAERMMVHFGLAPLLEAVHGSVEGGALDHKPELIAHILARHDLDPAHTAMVGDRRYDITGALANHVRAVGVLWGYGKREELEAAGADALADSPAALREILLR